MKSLQRILFVFIFLVLGIVNAFSQVVRSRTASKPVEESSQVTADTTKNYLKSTTGKDTVMMKSESGLETQVLIVANDSAWNEVKQNIMHLYSGAKVKYQDFELSADYIRLDRNNNMLFAICNTTSK